MTPADIAACLLLICLLIIIVFIVYKVATLDRKPKPAKEKPHKPQYKVGAILRKDAHHKETWETDKFVQLWRVAAVGERNYKLDRVNQESSGAHWFVLGHSPPPFSTPSSVYLDPSLASETANFKSVDGAYVIADERYYSKLEVALTQTTKDEV